MPQSIALPEELEEVFRSLESALDAQGAIPFGFKFDHWRGEWLKRPQPALGGSRPTDLMITPDGIRSVRRVLGAIIGGAYQ
ncbi:antitoxin Xre/MbcA/ParS toxin-binding domain-containing protein [Dokdonella sp.]|uniref:antitoxin Xre/MbcA/ParS toxin-binding domain-containing protein n=1 Tax=Dokdonella sp. TaxID=2291710 RepID=UPI003527970D